MTRPTAFTRNGGEARFTPQRTTSRSRNPTVPALEAIGTHDPRLHRQMLSLDRYVARFGGSRASIIDATATVSGAAELRVSSDQLDVPCEMPDGSSLNHLYSHCRRTVRFVRLDRVFVCLSPSVRVRRHCHAQPAARDRGAAGRRERRDRDARGRSADARRRCARRSGVGEGDADHGVLAGTARRGPARVGADRSPRDLHRRHALHRRGPVRPRSVRHHRLGRAPRRADGRHRQLPDDRRHLSRSAERVRVRHQPGRHRVRRPGHQRRAGRRRAGLRPDAVRRIRLGLQHQLGRRVDGAREDHRAGLVGGVRHSVPHAALSVGDGADLGHQFPAQHPAHATSAPTGRRFRASSICIGCRSPARSPACRRRRCATSASRRTCSATRSPRGQRRSTPRPTAMSAAT